MGLNQGKIKVIYIMGAGRSGSTLLNILLGNHPKIESGGELTNLCRSGWINNEYCACGERGNVCPFWSNVQKEWVKRSGTEDIEEYLALQNIFEYRWQLPFLKSRYKLFYRFQSYAKCTRALFEAIRTVSGKPIIVDSSKNPMRAFALSLIPEIDLHLIHLVRDVRGVAWSRKRTFRKDEKQGLPKDIKPKSIWRTAMFWIVTNIQSEWVLQQLNSHQSVQVRYEDFIANPHEILDKIGNLTKCDLDEVADRLNAGEAMAVGHTISGNRLRMAGSVKLQPDTEWVYKMPSRDQRLIWIITSWLMSQYGYK